MSAPQLPDLGRRRFLAGGALVVSFALLPALAAGADAAPLPGSLKTEPMLDGWIRIAADGAITVMTGKAELGQGIKTALIQLAAEELVVAPARIMLVTADTARTPDEGYTAGSHSMQDSGTAIRHAAAQVRAMLLDLAGARLGVAPASLAIADGVISAGRQRVTYGELVSGNELHVRAAPAVALRDPALHTVSGKPLARVDIPAKVSGGAAYIQDMRLPGMLHARIVRPPSPGAQLESLDESAARMAGVEKVVRDGRFIAVIARREYQAISAAQALAKGARWRESPILPEPARLYQSLQSAPSRDDVILERGSMAGAGGRTISATYKRPYQMHGSIGPSCAIAQLDGGSYTVWTHSQGVFPLRAALAEMLDVAGEQVRCIHVEGSGCYGHNGADDVAADAALLARALPGKPVRVQWMREEEHVWEPYGPPMVASASAELGSDGMIRHWDYAVWSNTHSTRPGKAGDLLAATHLAKPFTPPPPKPLPQPEGGGDRNAIPLYRLDNARVTHHFLPDMPLRVSALRSLGAYANVFAIESFMDELALAAGADPLAFRLRHMDDPRARQVMQAATARFDWTSYRKTANRGRGFAFARYKNLGAYAAIALEVEVARDTGLVRVTRVVAAVDSGEAVNPDGIRNQIEGGIVQSSSWTLCEEVPFDRTRPLARDWGGYPILRFPQVPDSIEVLVMERPGLPFLGTGEAAQGPTAAAIANAVAHASGVRLRELPLSRARVGAALGA
jgi:CO/xanthine dehydrogenase Mo-binding subunit